VFTSFFSGSGVPAGAGVAVADDFFFLFVLPFRFVLGPRDVPRLRGMEVSTVFHAAPFGPGDAQVLRDVEAGCWFFLFFLCSKGPRAFAVWFVARSGDPAQADHPLWVSF